MSSSTYNRLRSQQDNLYNSIDVPFYLFFFAGLYEHRDDQDDYLAPTKGAMRPHADMFHCFDDPSSTV